MLSLSFLQYGEFMAKLSIKERLEKAHKKAIGNDNDIIILELIERGYFGTKKEVIAEALKVLTNKIMEEEYSKYAAEKTVNDDDDETGEWL